ncbi:MAG: HD domain-containing protein [Proteobacteria bacterium]|nr:HD domain-containing protein [Pseudomonadota bacterium]
MNIKKNTYNKEFQSFLEQIYKQDGVEGLANCLPFVDGAFVVTVDGYVVAANDKFVDLVGYERSEIYDQSALKLTFQEDQEDVLKRIKEYNQDRYNLRLVAKDSSIKYVTVSPNIVKIDGTEYRLAEFIDNTPVIKLQDKQITSLEKMARALTITIEKRDPYTHGHMRRTAEIAVEISKLMSLEQEVIDAIWLGASIHDIGKIAVPIEILVKPDELDQHEWDFIKLHPVTGHNIVNDVDFIETVKQIILLHHERQDGSGYPYGVVGNNIPLEVAIVSVADSLEAIAGVRPYRKALTFEDAIEIMKNESHKFHNEALEAACSLVKNKKLIGKEYGLN